PLMRPTRTAEAPSDASNGPVTERAPSYTMSAARLTTPNPTTARHGDQDRLAAPNVLAEARSADAAWRAAAGFFNASPPLGFCQQRRQDPRACAAAVGTPARSRRRSLSRTP